MFQMAKPLESDQPVPTPSKDFDALLMDSESQSNLQVPSAAVNNQPGTANLRPSTKPKNLQSILNASSNSSELNEEQFLQVRTSHAMKTSPKFSAGNGRIPHVSPRRFTNQISPRNSNAMMNAPPVPSTLKERPAPQSLKLKSQSSA